MPEPIFQRPARAVQATFHQATAAAINPQGRTVEQWITSLHPALAIAPGEGSRWNSIARAMRENPAVMQKLAAGKIGEVPQGMISAFETLIAAAEL